MKISKFDYKFMSRNHLDYSLILAYYILLKYKNILFITIVVNAHDNYGNTVTRRYIYESYSIYIALTFTETVCMTSFSVNQLLNTV